MPGNSGWVGVVLQTRDLRLLDALQTFRIVDREQAGRIMGFGSVRRANARLLALTRAGFLRRSFIGTVGSGRRALYRMPNERAWRSQASIDHQLLVNAAHLTLGAVGEPYRLLRWRAFDSPLAPGIRLVPDGYAEVVRGEDVYPIFFEIDRGTESGRVWIEKARGYVAFAESGEFQRIFGRPRFRVAVLAPSWRRTGNVRRIVALVTDKLFWFSTFQILNRESLLAPDWLRPTGTDKVSLI